MKVELSAKARAQVREIDAWWRENRQAAPDLFTDELDRALFALEETPALGVRYAPRPSVRRLLLKRSGYHVYAQEEPERVFVVAVWSVFRRRGPRL